MLCSCLLQLIQLLLADCNIILHGNKNHRCQILYLSNISSKVIYHRTSSCITTLFLTTSIYVSPLSLPPLTTSLIRYTFTSHPSFDAKMRFICYNLSALGFYWFIRSFFIVQFRVLSETLMFNFDGLFMKEFFCEWWEKKDQWPRRDRASQPYRGVDVFYRYRLSHWMVSKLSWYLALASFTTSNLRLAPIFSSPFWNSLRLFMNQYQNLAFQLTFCMGTACLWQASMSWQQREPDPRSSMQVISSCRVSLTHFSSQFLDTKQAESISPITVSLFIFFIIKRQNSQATQFQLNSVHQK